MGGRERSLNGPFSGNELDPFLIRTERMDGRAGRQPREQQTGKLSIRFLGRPFVTPTTGRRQRRGRGGAPSAQMTTIHTNIPVQVREGATNSQQMEVVQGRRALVLEALARSVWCIVEERFTQTRQRTHPWIEKTFNDTFRCYLRQNENNELGKKGVR